MSYGHLTPKQLAAFARHVANRDVTDLGAGDQWLSRLAVMHKASSVTAVDKEPLKFVRGVVAVNGYFAFYTPEIDLAIISWPSNYRCGLTALIERARTVIYLGKCTDGVACGTPCLWEHLTRREVLWHEPDRTNTLIVYGPEPCDREPLLEERAGLNSETVLDYHD